VIDAEDGWSWSAPITGAPEKSGGGVSYQGVSYRKLYDYTGMVTYVLGEFYWQVTRNQRTFNTDYQGTGNAASKKLNREATGSGADSEVVWSAGATLSAEQVMAAFKLAPEKSAALQRDAAPTALNVSSTLVKILIWGAVIIVMLLLFRCGSGSSSNDCSNTLATYGAASQEYQTCLNSNRSSSGGGYRTGGGSFGGFSSGGGGSHK